MAPQREALEETIDRLYGLPLDEFTPARDAAVKERRAAKDREAAEMLRRLRKPNLVAWSLNRVRRSDPSAIEQLLAAGERLGEAQRQLVESGERGSLRGATADERAQVGRVAELASAALSAAGHPADAGVQSKLFATLHAAAASADVREQLALGRLLRDHELSDLGLGDGALLASPAPPARKRSTPKPSTPKRQAPKRPAPKRPAPEGSAPSRTAPKPADAESRARERKITALRGRLARASDRHRELAAKAEEARRLARDAERAVTRAARDLERAEAAAAKAAAAADRAAAAADSAEASVGALQDELATLGRACRCRSAAANPHPFVGSPADQP